MPKFIVHKSLTLNFECEADTFEEALDACIEADEIAEMSIIECDYSVTNTVTNETKDHDEIRHADEEE